MKRLACLLLTALACAPTLPVRATVSVEFQLGAVDLPPGSLGVLVADTGGNGFTPPSAAAGTVLSAGQSMGGGDDRIVAVFSVGALADWGGLRGFAAVVPPIDYGSLGVAAGQSLVFHAFPDRVAGQTIRAGEIAVTYRTDNAAELSGNMGFALPQDGGAYRLAAISSAQGGMANLSGFSPDIDIAFDGGAPIPNAGTIDFGNVAPNASATRTLRITNLGGATLSGSALTVEGSAAYQTSTPSTTTLLPGESVTVTITFQPAASGTHTGEWRLTSNDPDESPYVISLTGVGSNRPPTITDTGSQSTLEDTATPAILFTVGDPDVAPESLVVTAQSDNTTLLPLAGIALGGTGAQRSVILTPAANRSGSATVTLTVSDGAASVSDTFTLTVQPVNDRPTLSDTGNQSTPEDTPLNGIELSIGDIETAAADLIVTATSDTPTLIPNTGLALGGSGNSRTLSISPAANQFGAATITITVSDGDLSASDSFVVTVTSVNDQPTGPFLSQTSLAENLPAGSPVGNLTTSDADPADVHTYTLVGGTGSTDNASFAIEGGVLKLLPSADFETKPGYSVRIRSTDSGSGNLQTEQSFAITITDANDAPSDISLSPAVIAENNAPNATVGLLAALDQDPGDTHTFSLVTGAGSTDNASFTIDGAQLKLTPSANFEAKPNYALRVLVTDSGTGNRTFEKALAVTVTNVNEAPTLSDIPNQLTDEDTPKVGIPFTISDPETAPGSLTVTATSANQTVLPNAGIAIGGSGGNRTLSLTPAANQHGSAVVTVTVSDGTLSTSDTFTLQVGSVNDSPTISNVTDRTIDENTSSPPIPFTIGDPDTDPATLTLTAASTNTTLLPVANIVFGGSNTDRTVTLTPAADQTGTTTVTLTVSDGTTSATDTFVLTVNAVNNTPVTEILFTKGDNVPGAGVDPSLPANAKFDLFYPVAIDADGKVAFRFRWRAVRALGEGILADGVVVAATGHPAPGGAPTDTLYTFGDPQIANGAVVFPSNTRAGIKGIYTNLGGPIARVTAIGSTVPTPVNGLVGAVKSLLIDDTAIHWMGGLYAGYGGVTSASDMVVYRWTPTNGTQLVLREGMALGTLGTYLKAFVSLSAADPVEAQSRFQLGSGILAQVTFGTGAAGIIRAEPGAVELIAATGQPLGGTVGAPQLYTFGLPFGTSADWVGGLVRFRTNIAGVTTVNALAIVSGQPGLDYRTIAARTGFPATDTAGNNLPGTVYYKNFADPVFSPEGDAAYLAAIAGTGVTSVTDTGIWWRPAGATAPRLVAREGTQAAQALTGQWWSKFASMALPAGPNGPIFSAILAGSGISTANDAGIWAMDSEGDLNLVLREGAPLNGRFIRTFNVLKSSVGHLGVTRSFNNQGEIAVHVTYTNGQTGIVKITVP